MGLVTSVKVTVSGTGWPSAGEFGPWPHTLAGWVPAGLVADWTTDAAGRGELGERPAVAASRSATRLDGGLIQGLDSRRSDDIDAGQQVLSYLDSILDG